GQQDKDTTIFQTSGMRWEKRSVASIFLILYFSLSVAAKDIQRGSRRESCENAQGTCLPKGTSNCTELQGTGWEIAQNLECQKGRLCCIRSAAGEARVTARECRNGATESATCLQARGKCRKKCGPRQIELPGECSGVAGCKCCSRKSGNKPTNAVCKRDATATPECIAAKGKCRQKCGPKQIEIAGGCTGVDGCKCCGRKSGNGNCKKKATETAECKAANGRCRRKCGPKRTEIVGGCTGKAGCKCCARE
ncbi:hypothetical protein SK128_016062, partial [Halocaridina rubra]